ncbi:WXG100 family type VII secretion target [Streptomyces sp. NPDC002573]|uniref:WXG100 family type VII secretion target n=1 Tax=Streptomyces sp. NPDC002573 TaxID=3364651 RepID=UPI0036739C9B
MAFGTFDVDTGVLRTQGGNFVDLGGDFSNASKRLEDTLEGLGKPWEDADFGEVFGQVYTPIRDGILTSMGSLAKRLQQIGHNLQDMAHGYDGADASNNVLLNGISHQL